MTVKELAELLSNLPDEEQQKHVAIAVESDVRMNVDVVTTHKDEVILTDHAEFASKDDWS